MFPLQVNPERLSQYFDEFTQIGQTDEGGSQRTTFSPAHFAAREWFQNAALQAGLGFEIDRAGNHSARLNCAPAAAPTLLLGSHLDSVPNGGQYDGVLGVLAALEVLLTLKDSGLQLPFQLEAIDFTDEEGTVSGLLGSLAITGQLTPEMLAKPRCGHEYFQQGLERAGLSLAGVVSAQRAPETIRGYLELHIEQGSRLLAAGTHIGVVTSIVGINAYHIHFLGRADHAGTTPMPQRQNAAQGASAFLLDVHALVSEEYPNCTVNIGQIHLDPGAFNIVPAKATLNLEFRAPNDETLAAIDAEILKLAQTTAKKYNLRANAEFLSQHEAAPMSLEIQTAIQQAADHLGLKTMQLSSGAGHDAQSLAKICPTGMIFIPSVGGASHSPREFSEWADCLNGANVLLQTVLNLAKSA